jgi:SAM-dependent methyltransferase
MSSASPAANFNRIARPYRWLEYFSFGPVLEHCRFYRIPQLMSAKRALVLGDGDGRFLARLLAANPNLYADVVDQSPAMLRLLEARASAAEARNRIQIHQTDARAFTPSGRYDLVVTHFFLDCFTTVEVRTLAATIRPHLDPNARWLVSEFAIPNGIAALPARSVVASLYAAFRILTGLRTRSLPDYASILAISGLRLEDRKRFLAGLLVSELWSIEGRVPERPRLAHKE